MSDESNTIDYIMSKDPLDLTESDLTAIIAYQRKDRARADRGDKPEKPGAKAKAAPTKTSIDLQALGLVSAPKPRKADRRD